MTCRRALGIFLSLVLAFIMITGCGSSAKESAENDSAGAGSAKESEQVSGEEQTEDEKENKDEEEAEEDDTSNGENSLEAGADAVELMDEEGVRVLIEAEGASDGELVFTLFMSNSESEVRSVTDNELLINGTPAQEFRVEAHDSAGYTESFNLFARMAGGEKEKAVITLTDENLRQGETVQIDFEVKVIDDEINTLTTKMLEFGVDADGGIILGEELLALNLAQSAILEAETFPETVFLDEGGVKITGEGFSLNEENDRVLLLTVENGTSSDIRVRGNAAVVDGYNIPIYGADLDVPAGESATGEFQLAPRMLKDAGIRSIHDLSMSWRVSGDDVDDTLDPTAMVSVVTDKESAIDEVSTESFKELYIADGIQVLAEPEIQIPADGTPFFTLVIINDTEEPVRVEPVVKQADGGGTGGWLLVYPGTKTLSQVYVRNGDSYFIRVSKADDLTVIAETEETLIELSE